MGNSIGCGFRDVCDVYAGKYRGSPFLCENFKTTCDSEMNLTGICPFYDFNKGILEIVMSGTQDMNRELGNAAGLLEKTLSKFD